MLLLLYQLLVVILASVSTSNALVLNTTNSSSKLHFQSVPWTKCATSPSTLPPTTNSASCQYIHTGIVILQNKDREQLCETMNNTDSDLPSLISGKVVVLNSALSSHCSAARQYATALKWKAAMLISVDDILGEATYVCPGCGSGKREVEERVSPLVLGSQHDNRLPPFISVTHDFLKWCESNRDQTVTFEVGCDDYTEVVLGHFLQKEVIATASGVASALLSVACVATAVKMIRASSRRDVLATRVVCVRVTVVNLHAACFIVESLALLVMSVVLTSGLSIRGSRPLFKTNEEAVPKLQRYFGTHLVEFSLASTLVSSAMWRKLSLGSKLGSSRQGSDKPSRVSPISRLSVDEGSADARCADSFIVPALCLVLLPAQLASAFSAAYPFAVPYWFALSFVGGLSLVVSTVHFLNVRQVAVMLRRIALKSERSSRKRSDSSSESEKAPGSQSDQDEVVAIVEASEVNKARRAMCLELAKHTTTWSSAHLLFSWVYGITVISLWHVPSTSQVLFMLLSRLGMSLALIGLAPPNRGVASTSLLISAKWNLAKQSRIMRRITILTAGKDSSTPKAADSGEHNVEPQTILEPERLKSVFESNCTSHR